MSTKELIRECSNRYELSADGWKRMQAGREMGHLVREAVSNIFDLANVTKASVDVKDGYVCIEDNGENGFSDISLVSTIFMTDKEGDHTKRGRKGRGLKELIAAADKAIVETVGYTIEFENGRKEYKNDRKIGTRIELTSDLENWTGEHVEKAKEYLMSIIPSDGIELVVNGQIIHKPKLKATFQSYAETVIINDGVQRSDYRTTDINIYECLDVKNAWIFEMGIPIQKINCGFNIDVMQRVPVNDNRDTVNEYYLRRIYGDYLAHSISELKQEDLNSEWVVNGLCYASTETKKKFAEKFAGEKTVIKSGNEKANDLAKQYGFSILDSQKLAWAVKEAIESNVQHADAVVKQISEESEEQIEPSPEQKRFAAIHKWIGSKIIDESINIRFIKKNIQFGKTILANFNKKTLTISYNISSDMSFNDPMSEDNIGILLHEVAHFYPGSNGHDDVYIAALEKCGAKLAKIIMSNYDEFKQIINQKVISGKTATIKCVDCGAEREIKIQDVKQVTRCIMCQKKHRNYQKKLSGLR